MELPCWEASLKGRPQERVYAGELKGAFPDAALRTWPLTPPGEREMYYNPRGTAAPAQDGHSRAFSHISAK